MEDTRPIFSGLPRRIPIFDELRKKTDRIRTGCGARLSGTWRICCGSFSVPAGMFIPAVNT